MTKLDIYLCVQEEKRNTFRRIIANYILMHDCLMQVKYATSEPEILLNQISFSDHPNIYILDVDNHKKCNRELLMQLKILNPTGIVIFFGTSIKDYVVRNSKYMLETKWVEHGTYEIMIQKVLKYLASIYHAYHNNHYIDKKYLSIMSQGSKHLLKVNEIYFVETKKLQHKVIIHFKDGKIESNMSLREMYEYLVGNEFQKCHRSIIVNSEYISKVDLKERMIYMENGQQLECSVRCMKSLVQNISESLIQNANE